MKKGDNLWKIAETIYGDGTRWSLIYESNKDKLENPGDLTVGMELVIPGDTKKAETADAASTASTSAAAGTTANAAAETASE